MTRGTVPVAPAELSRVRRCTVTVKKGPSKGKTARLDDGALTFGSGPDCDVQLADDTVSARHCELLLRGEHVVVRDLGSRNGVFLNGVRVIEAICDKGAELRLGTSALLIDSADDEVLVSKEPRFGPLLGRSPAMRAVFAQLPAIAASPAPVLIDGETGTGKDLTAEAIHQASPRASGPFVIFDCGAVAASLVESELFGSEKGAFTGATSARDGLAQQADGGTLVLDELGELPLELQPKLLRLVERQEVRRVGSAKASRIDVRIIACTHRSLKAEVAAGRFREDLYFRLSTLRTRLPALRERPDDIPLLVDGLLAANGSLLRFTSLPESDRALLLSHRWPGNVRELRNTVDRLLTFPSSGVGALLEHDDAGASPVASPAGGSGGTLPALPIARQQATDAFESNYVRQVLARSDGSMTEAAKIAGVSRQFLRRLMNKHGLG